MNEATEGRLSRLRSLPFPLRSDHLLLTLPPFLSGFPVFRSLVCVGSAQLKLVELSPFPKSVNRECQSERPPKSLSHPQSGVITGLCSSLPLSENTELYLFSWQHKEPICQQWAEYSVLRLAVVLVTVQGVEFL